jgi:hypothetical protein
MGEVAEGRMRAAKPPSRQEIVVQEPDEASDALVRVVVDAALEVHRSMGPAFLESVYENALCHELVSAPRAFR